MSKESAKPPTLQWASEPNALQAESNRQADRVSELSESIQTYHSLDAKVGILVEHVAAFSAQLGELNARLEEASAKLAAADGELVAVRAVAKAQATASEGAERKVRRLESELETVKRSSQERESQFAERLARDVANHLTHIALLQEQLDIYERSHSWRLTAPIRAVRRKLGRALRRGKTYVDRMSHGVEPPSKGSITAAAPDTPPVSPKSQVAADAIPAPLVEPSVERGDTPSRALMVRLPDETAADYIPLNRSVPVETSIKLIAFYLPQFHPIPENDAWWGRGFTEWTNVSRAKPQFVGHYQPHLPGELGFYDLRLVEVQRRQIELARLHGIHGFCFHHYWFGGTKLLRRPLDQFLDHPELDFPFCLCWANENWTRKWDGRDDGILIGQQHSPEDDLAFIRDIEPALRDPRYIRVDGRLLLTVYRPALLPDASATAERWRVYCREVGLGELFLVSTHAFDHRDPREFGFDAATEFAPNNMAGVTNVSDITEINPDFRGVLYDYRELVATNCQRAVPAYPIFRCVTPMWDNEARRPSRGAVYAHSSPGLYRQWLQSVCSWAERHGGFDKPVVFVNAWNEWAEGAHLEPDQRYGYAYLQATAEALERFPIRTARASIV